jgi:hypothetical protein
VNALGIGRVKNERSWGGQVGAFLLILSLLLPFGQLAFGLNDPSEAAQPACCRTHGKHKCAMRMAMPSSDQRSSPQVAQITEKCPCTPGLATTAHGNLLWSYAHGIGEFYVNSGGADFTIKPQKRASNPDSANLKRGPPATSEST